MKNKIVKDTLALTVITLVSGLLLGLVNDCKPAGERERRGI